MTRYRNLVVVLFVLGVAARAGAQGEAPKPGPELKKLEVAIGAWQFEGQVHPSAFGPGGRIAGTERYEWLPGGFFMKLQRDAKGPMGDFKTLIVFGYDPAARQYTGTAFDSSGAYTSATVSIEGPIWRWRAQGRSGTGGAAYERCTITYGLSRMSMEVACDASSDGTTWVPSLSATYTRQLQ